MTSRRERIECLLIHYFDVVAGLQDGRGSDGEKLRLMCKAWNSPGYQELERLRLLMSRVAPPLYRAVVGMYVYPRFVRRAVCPRCEYVGPPSHIGELHKHASKTFALVARSVRVPLYPVDTALLVDAVAWFDEHWAGGVFVPDELLPLVA